MPLVFRIDDGAVSLILDGGLRRSIGTGFAFIKPTWVVTAKHVVIQQDPPGAIPLTTGVPRTELLISPYKRPSIRAKVIFEHPLVDLAVLELEYPVCKRPLFPAHHSLAGDSGFICAGYAPSKTDASGAAVLLFNEITSFVLAPYERLNLLEERIIFDAPFAEGGHSGGPIFGTGGGVVGVIVEDTLADGRSQVMGTSLAPLLDYVQFNNG